VIIYLNEEYDGGVTVFPRIRRRVKPELGKAVLFQNLTEDGKSWDRNALHQAESVASGEKWLSNQWIRQHRRHPDQARARGARRRSSGGRSSSRKR
jgi:prolyl 4-hydroxylase